VIGQHLQLRKAEIERLSSPEQLDTSMRVTQPLGWFALGAVGVLLAGVVAWGVWGKITDQVSGSGMILRGSSLRSVQATVAGTIKSIDVKVGDLLTPQEQVAELILTDLIAEIKKTEGHYEGLQEQKRGFDSRNREVRASYATQLRGLQAQLRKKKELLSRQLVTVQDILDLEGRIAGVKAQIAQAETGAGSLYLQIKDEGRKLEQLKSKLENDSIILSGVSGRVADILVSENEFIDAGRRILTLDNTQERDWEVLLFVPFTDGKKVLVGRQVHIAPTTVKPEEYGYIRGEVSWVASQPISYEKARTMLNNDQLAEKFATDSPFEVRVRPLLDEQGRFRWTSAKGDSLTIASNTPCSAKVLVRERQPISLIIPKLKEYAGID